MQQGFQEVENVESRCRWAARPQGRCDRRREKDCRDARKLPISDRQMSCDRQRRRVGSLRREGKV